MLSRLTRRWTKLASHIGPTACALLVLASTALAASILFAPLSFSPAASTAHAQETKKVKGDNSEKYPEERSGYLKVVEEYKTPGLETELSGIYPHPTDNNLYFVVTNGRPTYKPTMKPMLPVALRNKLLTVSRDGKVVKVQDLPDGGGLFGDLAYGDGHLWLGPLDPPAVWKLNLETGKVVARYPLPGPAGGMEFDRDRGQLIVSGYVGHPHLAFVDAKSGAIVKSIWGDENCQGLKKVDGDLITVYASSWDADAYSELWVLDQETGKPKSRLRMTGIHAAMAPLDKKVSGFEGFMTLVHVGSAVTGETVIRRFSYVSESRRNSSAGLSLTGDRTDGFAAIQFSPATTDSALNRERLESLVADAAKRGAKYVVLPEMSTIGTLPPKVKDGKYALAETVPGATTQFFGELAKKYGVWLTFSLPEQTEDGKGYHITTVLLNERGAVLTKHQKRVLRFNGEDGPATVGFARLLMDTVDDHGRRIGILSGDDLQSGVMRLAQRGADTILVSANWSAADPIRWTELCEQLAREYRVNLVVANRQPGIGGVYGRGTKPLVGDKDAKAEAVVASLETVRESWIVPSSLGLPSVPVPSNEPITPGLVELGRSLFFDPKLSSTGKVSCNSCHMPEKFFTNGKASGEGVFSRQTSRNVPSVLNAAFKTTLHWDGNPTTLEQQLKYPLSGFAEMNLRSYDDLTASIRARADYVAAFRAEMGIEPADITREHVSRALASFQRTLVSGNSAFDRYYYGKNKSALSDEARHGLELFQGKASCSACHMIEEDYALFTDGRFHRLGIGYVPEKQVYSDPGVGMVSNKDYAGMFFTPSLRNVAETAPYMHDGSAPTIEDAIRLHYQRPDPEINRDTALMSVVLSQTELGYLAAFLRSLTGEERYNARGERLNQGAGQPTLGLFRSSSK
jgi:cytochrome c peroxidase